MTHGFHIDIAVHGYRIHFIVFLFALEIFTFEFSHDCKDLIRFVQVVAHVFHVAVVVHVLFFLSSAVPRWCLELYSMC
jgi:hypothetical protein